MSFGQEILDIAIIQGRGVEKKLNHLPLKCFLHCTDGRIKYYKTECSFFRKNLYVDKCLLYTSSCKMTVEI
jgi:hypothetical protein